MTHDVPSEQWIHEKYMDQALNEARNAELAGEVPVGAVVADRDGTVIASGFNQPISRQDPTAHAEIVAMRLAAKITGNYRLSNLTLYCTMEPCLMCAGAMVHARIQRLVYGTADLRAGAVGSIYNVLADSRLNHQVEVISGVREQECRQIVQRFFAVKRL